MILKECNGKFVNPVWWKMPFCQWTFPEELYTACPHLNSLVENFNEMEEIIAILISLVMVLQILRFACPIGNKKEN